MPAAEPFSALRSMPIVAVRVRTSDASNSRGTTRTSVARPPSIASFAASGDADCPTTSTSPEATSRVTSPRDVVVRSKSTT
jgi:hypothetical protein